MPNLSPPYDTDAVLLQEDKAFVRVSAARRRHCMATIFATMECNHRPLDRLSLDIFSSNFLSPLSCQQWMGTVAYAEGGCGGCPPRKIWIFRLKNARFLSFETPYPMYFHG